MEGIYHVTRDGQMAGTVEVRREGLYCRLHCRCKSFDGGIHRLYADDRKLGVLIPDRGELVLETKVAAKRLQEGCVFTLDGSRENFIPIHPGEAFSHLDKVHRAKFVFRDGEPGMIWSV